MRSNRGYDPFDLLSQFTNLRQNGVNRDDAWFQVLAGLGEALHPRTKQTFLTLAKNWERREGHNYHYRPQDNRHAAMSRQQVGHVQDAAPHKPVLPDRNKMTGTLDPSRLRQYQQRGLEKILDQVEAAPVKNTTPLRQLRNPEYFGPDVFLLMYFMGHPRPLVVNIKGEDELYIGRATPNSAMAPEIDLTAVNGEDYGVSRMHAAITRRDNKLLIVDLNSMNHTRLNGVRLPPEKIERLHHDDEIWFGQLRCKIRFKQR